jgi:crossover junction endodeoxyribonuclease RuvC
MRVLGIDPGIATCGYAVVDEPVLQGREPMLTACGALRPSAAGAARLAQLFEAVRGVLAEHRPDAAAVERLYHNRNVRTASQVAEARGVILLALVQAGLPVAEYTPTEVKLAVTGYGAADKQQVRRLVAARLHLPRPPRPDDAADAVGLCLCHLQGQGMRRLLAGRREDAAGPRSGPGAAAPGPPQAAEEGGWGR